MERASFVASVLLSLCVACSSRSQTHYVGVPADGGSAGTGGGSDSGGSSAGGAGGTNDGGTSGGGTSSGGTNSAGTSNGGTSNGGSAAGEGGEAGSGGSAGGSGGQNGSECPAAGCPRSCDGLPNDCGPDQNQNCCASVEVEVGAFPMGRSESGTDAFPEGDANELPEHTASVIGLRIDLFEVSYGRFLKFVEAAPGSFPAPGDGAHPGIPNSGWKAEWDAELEYLTSTLSCGNSSVFTDPPSPSVPRNLPINCLSYYIAFAFCAWDGGFLPSEADWEAIAAGGSENRLYPWGQQPPSITLANYDCLYSDMPQAGCWFPDIAPVGSLPGGRGRYGHYDLAGGMEEWVLDAFSLDWYTGGGATCTNCANLDDGTSDGNFKILRGGSWIGGPELLRAAHGTS